MAWWQTAQPGDKVVCIKRGPWIGWPSGQPYLEPSPAFGVVCVVERVGMDGGFAVFALAGYPGQWRCDRFRPVEKKRGSASREVAKLRDLLNTAPVPADLIPTSEDA
jgi:hypothetical protein